MGGPYMTVAARRASPRRLAGEDRFAGSARPAVPQLDDPAGRGGAGHQLERVRREVTVEQPRALARDVGEHAHVELVDQVELHERQPEPDAAPDDDVAVAAEPELVD